MTTTKHLLFRALETGGPLFLVNDSIGGVLASVSAVEREDGSNQSFNVTGQQTRFGPKQTIHVTTID